MIYLESVSLFIVRLLHLWKVYSVKQYFSGISTKVCEVSNFISSSNYWSSTTNANNIENAWNVIVVYALGWNFNNGNSNNNNKTNNNYVRCVRGGE